MSRQRVNQVLSTYSGHSYTILRLGLGFVILLAGTHKLFQPGIWGSYTATWAVDILTSLGLSVDVFMRANGVLEAVLGLAILANRYTTIAAGIVSLSLLGIVINLAATGSFVDVLIRDLGLFLLAVGVTLMAAQRRTSETGPGF